MKNKVLAAITAAALALTLTGCGEDEKSSTPASSSDETSSVSSSSVDNASSAAGSDSSSSETQGEQPSDPISGSPLQVVLYGGGRADFIITNALMDLNVGGDCDVWLVTPQTTYSIVLLVDNFSAEEKPKFECHFDELDRNKPDPYEADTHPLGDADYSYSGSTLTLSLDTSRYGVSIDFGSITEYILFNGSKGNGAAPWTFQPADVVVDKRGGSSGSESSSSSSSSSESTSSGGTTPVDPPSGFDTPSLNIDYTGEYTLDGGNSSVTYLEITENTGDGKKYTLLFGTPRDKNFVSWNGTFECEHFDRINADLDAPAYGLGEGRDNGMIWDIIPNADGSLTCTVKGYSTSGRATATGTFRKK